MSAMEAVIFDGKEYVKASVVAEKFSYTQDYLGQLCRAKKIDARLVGRAWYIHLDSLLDHKKTRYKTASGDSQPKSEALPRYLNRIDVEPVLKKKTVKIIKNINGKLTEYPAKYESDDYSLIPRISKEAVYKELPVEPAEAGDLPVKTLAEGLKITTFKPEALPEVYLKGVLEVTGLPEANEEPGEDSSQKKSVNESINEPLPVKPILERPPIVPLAESQEQTKKPLKIKVYKTTSNVSATATRSVQPNGSSPQVKKVPQPQSIRKPTLLTTVKPISSLKNTEIRRTSSLSKSEDEVPSIPYASLKATSLLLVGFLFASGLLFVEETTYVTDSGESRDFSFSLTVAERMVGFGGF